MFLVLLIFVTYKYHAMSEQDIKYKVKLAIAKTMPVETSSNLAEIQLVYKSKVKVSNMEKIRDSRTASEVFRRVWSQDMEYREEMLMLCMNRAHSVLGWVKISAGGTSGTVVDPKVVMQHALKVNASAFMICHNHPSGNLKPSSEDLRLTKRLRELGSLMELPLLDHIIIAEDGYFSFADEGIL